MFDPLDPTYYSELQTQLDQMLKTVRKIRSSDEWEVIPYEGVIVQLYQV